MCKKWLIANRIICIRYKYLKPFNWLQKNELRIVLKCYPQNVLTISRNTPSGAPDHIASDFSSKIIRSFGSFSIIHLHWCDPAIVDQPPARGHESNRSKKKKKKTVQLLLCGWCLQDLFNILELLPSSFYSIRLLSVHVVLPYSSIDTTAAGKKLSFILSVRSDFHLTDSLLIAVHAFASRVLMPISVDEILLPR